MTERTSWPSLVFWRIGPRRCELWMASGLAELRVFTDDTLVYAERAPLEELWKRAEELRERRLWQGSPTRADMSDLRFEFEFDPIVPGMPLTVTLRDRELPPPHIVGVGTGETMESAVRNLWSTLRDQGAPDQIVVLVESSYRNLTGRLPAPPNPAQGE